MDNYLDVARKNLAELPQSEKKEAALKLIDEIEKNEIKQNEILTQKLDEIIAKLNSIKTDGNFFRLLPWFTSALSFYAFYIGITAVISSEFCSRSRNGFIGCSHGTVAQLNGLSVILIGLIIFVLPLTVRATGRKWLTVTLWILSIFLLLSIFGGLLVHR